MRKSRNRNKKGFTPTPIPHNNFGIAKDSDNAHMARNQRKTSSRIGVSSPSERGFTLVETLVAIAILVTAVIGASSAAQTGISLAVFSRDQIVAFYLAQEGVEQIRNMRDENGLNVNGRHWLSGISEISSDPCYFGKTCMVDALSNSISACSGGAGSCPVLKQDPDNDFFGYNSSWTDTNFKREVRLTQINANEVSMLVTITWNKGVINREFRARENILNWQ